MAEKIKVLIVDDIEATRINISNLLAFHPEVCLVGQAASAEEGIKLAKTLLPDVILMDINMPGMDGIKATEILNIEVPTAGIIVISVQGEPEYIRRAMVAGAKNYLPKPFGVDELLQAIKQAYDSHRRKPASGQGSEARRRGQIITVFSTKGGVGKTTIASNLAVTLEMSTGMKVGLVDADLQFGDVALFLNILPKVTIADLIKDIDQLDERLLNSYLFNYKENVRVLPAPFRPEQAEFITGKHLTAILEEMRASFDYIVVDTAPAFNDAMLAVLDVSDKVLVVSVTDLPTIKNVKICLEVMETLGYDKEKIKLVLNRAHSESGLDLNEVEESLRYKFSATLPSDGKTVVASVNRGIPFVVSNPDTQIAKSIYGLIRAITPQDTDDEPTQSGGLVHKIKRLFG